jgi:hypothetical protein
MAYGEHSEVWAVAKIVKSVLQQRGLQFAHDLESGSEGGAATKAPAFQTKLDKLIRHCMHDDPMCRPNMHSFAARLKGIKEDVEGAEYLGARRAVPL